MGTFLLRGFLVLTALSSFCGATGSPHTCKAKKVKLLQELAGIQRGTEAALREIVQTQCQKTQDKNTEALTKLAGRLDVIEAKNAKVMQTLENNTEALKNLTDRFDVIEAKVDTQAEETNQLREKQTSHQDDLQAVKDTLNTMQEQLTQVARLALQPSFEPVGDDSVHLPKKRMTWKDARRYCWAIGGDLLVPTDKEGFIVDTRRRTLSDPHPPLFDFLKRKLKQFGLRTIVAWLGASVDGDGKATWTSGKKMESHKDFPTPGTCFFAAVRKDGTYKFWAQKCNYSRVYPLCH